MKKIFLLLVLALLSMLTITAQDTIYLWPSQVPGETEPKSLPEISPNKSRDVLRFSKVTNPYLVVFKPSEDIKPNVGMIVCPGGGYSHLAVNIEGYEVAEWLNSIGITAYVLIYRVPDRRDGAFTDIQRAIRIVRNINSNQKIGVMGFSAGGNLSAKAATLFNIDTYSHIDEKDSLSCKPDFATLIYPAYLDLGPGRSITPDLILGKETPPFFIFGCSDDLHGNSCLVMTSELRENKIPIELHFYNEGGHGYGLRKGNIAAEKWPELFNLWLKKIIIN